MRISNDRDLPDSLDGWPRDQRARVFLRRDGDQLDVSWQYLFPEWFKVRTSTRSRVVLTKDLGIRYEVAVYVVKATKGVVSNDYAAWFTGMAISEITGGPLDGYFPPSGTHRIAELMAEADDIDLRGTEAIGGTPCQVVQARTRHGNYVVWIAETQGFLPLKVTYEIGPDQLHEYGDDRPFAQTSITTPEGDKHSASTASGILQDVRVERISDTFVPVAGKFTLREHYTDVQLISANSYKRTDINLNPRFEGTDAFVIDLAERALLSNMSDLSSGVAYEWREGKVRPAGTDLGGSVPVGSWTGQSAVRQYLLAALGLVFLGTGINLARRSRGESHVSR